MNDPTKLFTMRTLGHNGQWGNQLIQYAFMRTAARRFGLDYQVPAWSGQHFFGFHDPPATVDLPDLAERFEPCPVERFGIPIPPAGEELAGRDYRGWCQFHTSWYRPDREFILGLYDGLRQEPADRFFPLLERLRRRGKTLIGLHLRRGDNGRYIYLLTPILWCLRWLHRNWARFDRPVLFIATEDKNLLEPFAAYDPVLIEDLGYQYVSTPPPLYEYPYQQEQGTRRQLNFFGDWFLLQHCDVVLASESTYSFSAAWVSRVNREFWRPRLSLQDFERVDPWDTHVSPREHLDDFPGIPGTAQQLDPDDPRWRPHWRDYRHKVPPVAEDPDTWKPFCKPPAH